MTIAKTIILDGTKIRLKPPDLDGDGETGGIEYISRNNDITPVQTETELGQAMANLNDDSMQMESRMSSIDMRARLHYIEVSYILALDALVSLGVLPTKTLPFTRQKKRLSVSIDGKGRDEMVRLVAGQREHDVDKGSGMGTRFADRFKSFMGGGAAGKK